jgi:pimeloyl-ACP methyl ester carboxylesterase
MQKVQTKSGDEIAYRVIGGGDKAMVLVHGWMVSGAVYDDLIGSLDQEKFRLIVPDLRGSGHSSKDMDSFELADYVSDLVAVVDHAGLETFGLVGHSMGGQVAQLFAANYPERVERLALVGTVPASGIALPDEAHELFFESGQNRESQATILAMACLDLDDDAKERLLDDAAKIPVKCIQQSYLAWTAGGFDDRLVDVKAPTLVVASDDPFLPREFLQAAVVELISGAEMAHIGGAGHYVLVERAAQTAKLLTSFFGQG